MDLLDWGLLVLCSLMAALLIGWLSVLGWPAPGEIVSGLDR